MLGPFLCPPTGSATGSGQDRQRDRMPAEGPERLASVRQWSQWHSAAGSAGRAGSASRADRQRADRQRQRATDTLSPSRDSPRTVTDRQQTGGQCATACDRHPTGIRQRADSVPTGSRQRATGSRRPRPKQGRQTHGGRGSGARRGWKRVTPPSQNRRRGTSLPNCWRTVGQLLDSTFPTVRIALVLVTSSKFSVTNFANLVYTGARCRGCVSLLF
jgi:hypothetical protein